MSLMIANNGARGRRSPRWGLVGNAKAMDRLFDEFWRDVQRTPAAFVGESAKHFVPHLDVVESEEGYLVRAELPGLEREDFQVTLEEDVLTIQGEKKTRARSEDDRCRRSETRAGRFERRIRFDGPVDADAVKASYKNGVLEVTVARPEELQPESRTIPVQSA
ncbi:MAG: Hsp20/alpha crystallin family protein [Myxococcota bacterium]